MAIFPQKWTPNLQISRLVRKNSSFLASKLNQPVVTNYTRYHKNVKTACSHTYIHHNRFYGIYMVPFCLLIKMFLFSVGYWWYLTRRRWFSRRTTANLSLCLGNLTSVTTWKTSPTGSPFQPLTSKRRRRCISGTRRRTTGRRSYTKVSKNSAKSISNDLN